MNEICVLLYPMLYTLSYFNLQFNYILAFHRAKFLSLNVKKGDRYRFLLNGES